MFDRRNLPVSAVLQTIQTPVMFPCGGRCGKVAIVHFPSKFDLSDLRHELHAQGWFLGLASTDTDVAVAAVCGRCGPAALPPPRMR